MYPFTNDLSHSIENAGVIDIKPNGHYEYGLNNFNSYPQYDVVKSNAVVPDFTNDFTHYDYRCYENDSYAAIETNSSSELFHV